MEFIPPNFICVKIKHLTVSYSGPLSSEGKRGSLEEDSELSGVVMGCPWAAEGLYRADLDWSCLEQQMPSFSSWKCCKLNSCKMCGDLNPQASLYLVFTRTVC